MCTFLLQNGALWIMELMHCGICVTGLLHSHKTMGPILWSICKSYKSHIRMIRWPMIWTKYLPISHKYIIIFPSKEQLLTRRTKMSKVWIVLSVDRFVCRKKNSSHYDDVIMGAISSQITSLTIVFSTVYLDTDQRKHQSSASRAFVRGIHRRPVDSPHKWPVTRKMFPFDDVIM